MQKGFTLLEVMIAVVVVAILASVAVPAYSDYVVRGKLIQATSGLSDGRIKMEQYFQDNRTFDGGEAICPADTEFFTFACVTVAAAPPVPSTYTITATGKDNLAAYSFTIDQDNTKTSTTPYSGGSLRPCWITSRGESC